VVEIRVTVGDAAKVHGLMRRFVGVFGRAAVSFDAARAVDQVVGAVEAWLAEDGIGSATLAIDDVAYTVVAP
jgi:hypothetical protein